MKMRMDKQLLSYTALGGLAGVLIGVLIVKMNLAPAPEALRVLEQEAIQQILKAQEKTDQAAMQGACDNDIIKVLPSGAIAKCVDSKWGKPTQLGLEGADGVIRQVPPFCGLNAHVVADQQHGNLCAQNEGSWRTAATGEMGRFPPCLLPNGSNQCPGGHLVQCTMIDGKTVYSC